MVVLVLLLLLLPLVLMVMLVLPLQAYGIIEGTGEASALMFAILFGLVAGMMVAIVFIEVLPTAYRWALLK